MAEPRVNRYASNLIPGLQQAFGTAGEALAFLKEQGLGVRRQNFLWEWGAQLKETAARPTHYSATLEQYPATASVVERRTPRQRGYHYVVQHLIEDPDSGELYFTYGGYRNDRLVSYGEAISGAEGAFLEGQAGDARYPQGNLLGTQVFAVRNYLPELDEVTA